MYSREKQGDVPLSKYVPKVITLKMGELFSNAAQFFARLFLRGLFVRLIFISLKLHF
jgi:hypothetical protein